MRILLVDDNLEFLNVLTSFIHVDGRHSIVGRALSGRDAVDLAAALRPQVALVDYDMPGIDGPETIRRIKDVVPGVRAVMLSGFAEAEYARQAIRVGAEAFVSKSRIAEELFPLLAGMDLPTLP